MQELMIAATMLIDFITLTALGLKLLGHGSAKPTGILLIVSGVFHFFVGLTLIFVVGDGYDGFIVWLFSYTFIFAGVVIGWELNAKALGNMAFAIGTIILLYTIDYFRAGYTIWTLILVMFVLVYYLFVASCYGKVSDKIVAYCVLLAAFVCLLAGAPYLWGYTF